MVGADPGGGSGGEEASGGLQPILVAVVGAAALGLVVLGVVAMRRRRHGREGIPVADTTPWSAPVEPPRSIDEPVPFMPRLRAFDLGDEANMPRWLRPSVRAERFSTLHTDARSSTDPVSSEDAALKNSSVDLDALFAARRSIEPGSKPSNRGAVRRQRPAPS